MKQFYRCTRILDYEQTEKHVDFQCVLGTHGCTTLRIIPVAHDTLCVKFIPTVVDMNHLLRVPKDHIAAPNWTFQEHESHYIMCVGEYEILIKKDPFCFVVKQRDGSIVLSSNDDDYTTWNFPLTSGWGVTAETEDQNLFSSVASSHMTFSSRFDEKYYGLGEQFSSCQQRGIKRTLHNHNGQGVRALSYKNVPFMISSYGYALFIDTYYDVTFDLGRTSNRSIEIIQPQAEMDCYIFLGDNPKNLLQAYTRLTGRPGDVPLWSFGLWISTYFIETDETRVRTQIEEYRKREIPVDVYHFDCFWLRDSMWNDFTWNTSRFPNPPKLLEDMRADGYKISLWENSYISLFSDMYREAKEKGYLIRNAKGEVYRAQTWRKDLMPATGIVDFTNPEAVSWWKQWHEKLIAMGVDAFKTDFGEAIPEDSLFFNGKTGEEMHNAYAHIYNECVYEITKELRGESLVWARTAWAGTQRFPTHWGGDPHCTWEDMASGLRGGLSFSLSGFAYWSHDIGGFKGVPSSELYVRWAQLGLLTAHARLHGWSNRDPWIFGEEACEIVKKYTRLRYSLLPYFDALANEASLTGLPLMRHLFLQYPQDETVSHIDSQFMLGDGILVNPVLRPGGAVSYYLPKGEWYDLQTGDVHSGSHYIHKTCSLEEMPLYVQVGYPLLRTKISQAIDRTDPYEALLIQIALDDTTQEATYDFTLSCGQIGVQIGKKQEDVIIDIFIEGKLVKKPISVLLHGKTASVRVNQVLATKTEVSTACVEEFGIPTVGTYYKVEKQET